MKMTIIALSICATMIVFNNNTAKNKQNLASLKTTSAHDQSIKTVIFDLGDVLFTSSRKEQTKILLWMGLQNPSIMYHLMTKNIKKDLFDMLDKVPAKTCDQHLMMYHQGQQLPPIMADWMTGRSTQDITTATLTHVSQSDYSTAQKKLFCKIIQFMFQPIQFAQAMEPIELTTILAHSLKAHGYKLYVLSNWDHESFPILCQKHQELFNIFDGIMISGTEGIGKPNPQVYINLLQKYNLKAEECIFIDDEIHNVQAACNLGINGILHHSWDSTCLELQNLGILQKTNE